MNHLLNRISITARVWLLSSICILGLVCTSIYMANDAYDQGLRARQQLVKQTVESAYGVLTWAQQMEASGQMDRDQAQAAAKQVLAKMRYGNNEYYFLSDMQANVVMHPIKPALDGKSGSAIRDTNGVVIFEAFADKVRKDQSGFVAYLWPKPGKDQPVEKISFVQGFAPWSWIVGSGLYVDDLWDAFVVSITRIGVAVLLSGILIIWITRVISRSLGKGMGQAVGVVNRMAEGDLSASIESHGKDEIALLLNSMAAMQSSLSLVVAKVRQGAENVATASAEIAKGNQDLSSRTENQASALEQTAAATEQLTATVKQNANSAAQANQLAMNASSVAVRGGEVVAQVVNTMKDINQSSRKIADIISVIDGIAFQTNILALNAAVEAARAGEQGRGFAVVASEVRSLAGRSAAAAKEIKGLIHTSVERVEHGTILVDQAGETMNEVVSSIRRVTDLMGEIDTASSQQSQGVSQVGEAVTQMDQATQQNAALVEEMAAAADSLKTQAQDLVQTMSVFTLASSMGRHVALSGTPMRTRQSLAQPLKKIEQQVQSNPIRTGTAAPAKQIKAQPMLKVGNGSAVDTDWETF